MRKPFLTPPSLPDDEQCRTLIIPSSKYWLGIFNSALLEMLNPYNWEQVNNTDLTIDETIALIQAIINDYFDTEGCGIDSSCLQASGARVMRLSATGHLQQLASGVWEEPTDDYAVPSVPERGEASPYSRRCAAAGNAANVLYQLYEEVTSAIAGDLSDAEIIAAMAALLVASIGLWLGLAIAALVGLVYGLFKAFVEIARYMTIDLWDNDFTQLLECVLFNCADSVGDVVTFDLTCVNEELADAVDLTDLDALTQLKLFGQVQFMLSVIGVDGLNAAGATTAIDDAACEDCGEWCYEFDFAVGNGGWTLPYTGYGVYVGGSGFDDTYYAPSSTRATYIRKTFAETRITYIKFTYNETLGSISGGGQVRGAGIWGGIDNIATAFTTFLSNSAGVDLTHAYSTAVGVLINTIEVGAHCGNLAGANSDPGGNLLIKKVEIHGVGENPFGADNCEIGD